MTNKFLKVLEIETTEPHEKENQDGYHYAIKATRYRNGSIISIWQRTYWHRTPITEAIADLAEFTNDWTIGIMEANK